MSFISSYNESILRNEMLIHQYGNIPSYALWREYDINMETKEQRIAWWRETMEKCKKDGLYNNFISKLSNIIMKE